MLPLCAAAQVVDSTSAKNSATWIDVNGGFGALTKVAGGSTTRDWWGRSYYTPLSWSTYSIGDAGISINYQYGGLVLVGRIGTFGVTFDEAYEEKNPAYSGEAWASEDAYSSSYAGGAIGWHWPYFGIDAGLLYFDKLHPFYFPVNESHIQPMGKIRIGFEDVWYWSISFLYNNTLITHGAELEWGLGFHFPETKSSMWLGVGMYPQPDGVLIARATIAPQQWKFAVLFSGNFGWHSQTAQVDFGLSLGARLEL